MLALSLSCVCVSVHVCVSVTVSMSVDVTHTSLVETPLAQGERGLLWVGATGILELLYIACKPQHDDFVVTKSNQPHVFASVNRPVMTV